MDFLSAQYLQALLEPGSILSWATGYGAGLVARWQLTSGSSSDSNPDSESQPTEVSVFPAVTVLHIARWVSMCDGTLNEDKISFEPPA
jgi:hypothetical protein